MGGPCRPGRAISGLSRIRSRIDPQDEVGLHAGIRSFAGVMSRWMISTRSKGSGFHGRSYSYAGVMWRLIAYARSSAFVLTFNVSIIRYL
jgi:hypothetical protein